MGLDDYTPYQQRIIKRYYQNQDKVALQRLSELVTELFLAEGKKRAKVWEQAVAAMRKLGVGDQRIAHLVERNDPALIARLVKELQSE